MKNVKRAEHSYDDQVQTTVKPPLHKEKKEKNHLSFKLSVDKTRRVSNNTRCPKMYGKIKIFLWGWGLRSTPAYWSVHCICSSGQQTGQFTREVKNTKHRFDDCGNMAWRVSTAREFKMAINSEPIWILSSQRKHVWCLRKLIELSASWVVLIKAELTSNHNHSVAETFSSRLTSFMFVSLCR